MKKRKLLSAVTAIAMTHCMLFTSLPYNGIHANASTFTASDDDYYDDDYYDDNDSYISLLSVTNATTNTITLTWTTNCTSSMTLLVKVVNTDSLSEKTVQEITNLPSSCDSYTVTNLEPGRRYRFVLSNGDDSSDYCNYEIFGYTKLTQVTLRDMYYDCFQKISCHFFWESQDASDFYHEVVIKDAKGNTVVNKKIITNNYNFVTKKKQLYTAYIRQVGYQNDVNKLEYGEWASFIIFGAPNIKKSAIKKVGKKKLLTATWEKTGANAGYDVYVSKHHNNGYKKIKSTSSKTNSIKLKSFKGKAIKGTYYIYVVAKYKYNGETKYSPSNYTWKVGNNAALTK